MADQELNHLIKMANQIVAHCAPGESAAVTAARAANHMTRFWAPSMKRQIKDYLFKGGDLLSDVTKEAVNQLG